MKGRAALLSHATDEWTTPRAFFEALDARYHFDADIAATTENTLVRNAYYTKTYSALAGDWPSEWRAVWLNPPYSQCRAFMGYAAHQAYRHGMTVVALVPARTDTRWFHAWVYEKRGVTVTFIPGRLKFSDSDHGAPFPSMLVVFHGPQMDEPVALPVSRRQETY